MKIGSISYSLFLYKSKVNNNGKAPIYCKLSHNGAIKLVSTDILQLGNDLSYL